MKYFDPSGYGSDPCVPPEQNASEKTPGNKASADTPTSQSQMQKQVEKGQAPKGVDRVDKPHVEGPQPHVHFKEGTLLNQDGTVHDAHRGIPNPTKKIKIG